MIEAMEMIRQQHAELKADWAMAGSPKTFYEWLLDRVERNYQQKVDY